MGEVALRERLERGVVALGDTGIEYHFARSVGVGGVSLDDVLAAAPLAAHAAAAFNELERSGSTSGMSEAVLWPRVGSGEPGDASADHVVASLEAWAEGARACDVVVSVGIGGSYLGNRVLRDALLGTAWNALPRALRGDRPELWFAGQHLDPLEARGLVDLLRARAAERSLRVGVVVVSKSGTTTETLATTLSLLKVLGEVPRLTVALTAVTAPGSVLAEIALHHGGDLIRFPHGIGGRFSVLSPCGLVTAAASGVPVRELLAGARAARAAHLAPPSPESLGHDPALLYATLHHLHARKGRNVAVFMPYAERLRCVSEWYVQLLAESLGKARDREGGLVNAGRTPLVAVGTTDMHAQTQLHQEGPHDKTVTTLDVRDWGQATTADRVPDDPAARTLAGRTFAELNTLARQANEEALHASGRPSDAFVLARLDAKTLGALLYMLMASVAFEGELLDVCAYDQPGVEAYKKIMLGRMKAPG